MPARGPSWPIRGSPCPLVTEGASWSERGFPKPDRRGPLGLPGGPLLYVLYVDLQVGLLGLIRGPLDLREGLLALRGGLRGL